MKSFLVYAFIALWIIVMLACVSSCLGGHSSYSKSNPYDEYGAKYAIKHIARNS